MGLFQWLRRLTAAPGEAAVDRTRKDVLVPLYSVGGPLAALGLASMAPYMYAVTDQSRSAAAGDILSFAALLTAAASMLPVFVYMVRTKRVTRQICEYSGVGVAAAVLLGDVGLSFGRYETFANVNVLVLDLLLVCRCREPFAKVVVVTTALWAVVRVVLNLEDVAGPPFEEKFTRFSFWYFMALVTGSALRCTILIVDFHFTRGFATSMTEQQALVEASVLVSEAAAVLLSRYETEATATLLGGADGDKLPPLLRSALLQLVDNLAQYRPYLPQSCLPNHDGSESSTHTPGDPSKAEDGDGASGGSRQVRNSGSADDDERGSAGSTRCSSASLDAAVVPRNHVLRLRTEIAQRKVSLVAVNAKSFLRSCGDREWAARFVRDEVDGFLGAVAAERGVVDAVSGDHAFANFNASRMCTTHKVSAARVAWGVASPPAAGRTAATCSGAALCGDFGTSEMRRFMILGPVHNRLQCLDRVAAQLTTTLADETVGADADVKTNFFTVLLERLHFPKCDAKPFLLWQLSGVREQADGPDEWMYELERQAPGPHADWNARVDEWLHFGPPVPASELTRLRGPFESSALSRERSQSELREAGVSGDTVLFADADVCLQTL